MCLVNRRGLGKAKHVDMQNLWIHGASKSKRFVAKKVGTNVIFVAHMECCYFRIVTWNALIIEHGSVSRVW